MIAVAPRDITEGLLVQDLAESSYRSHSSIARSDLDKIMVSPAHFKESLGKPSEPSDAMKWGTLVHAAVLEPKTFWPTVVVYDGAVRRGKAWDAFKAAHADKQILTRREEADLLLVSDAVNGLGILTDAMVEASAFWTDEKTGVDCKARLDIIHKTGIYDIKTTSKPPEDFANSIGEYGYDRQAAWYLDAAQAAGIECRGRFVFLIVQTTGEKRIEFVALTAEQLDKGRRENEENLALYKSCLDANHWPEHAKEKESFMSEATTLTVVDPASDPFRVIRGKQPSAWKALVYGQPGIGKSSLAAYAPSPIFLDLENGLARVDCVKTPSQLKTFDEVKGWLRHLVSSPDYKTIVIDTIDALERMLAERVVDSWNKSNKKVTTVADIPYGRGGDLLVAEWKEVIDIFDVITARGKNVLLIGHEQIVKFENPTDANYDFYTVNVHKKAAPVVVAKLDAVLFARLETMVKGDTEKGKAVSTGRRVLHTTQAASFVAKSRFDLPAEVSMERGSEQKLFDLFI